VVDPTLCKNADVLCLIEYELMQNSNKGNVIARRNVLRRDGRKSPINYVKMALVCRRATPSPPRLLLGYELVEGGCFSGSACARRNSSSILHMPLTKDSRLSAPAFKKSHSFLLEQVSRNGTLRE
jgi:hypothetical protein